MFSLDRHLSHVGRIACLCASLCGTLCISDAEATESDWRYSLTAHGFAGQYRESKQRDALIGGGVVFTADNGRRGGVALGYNHSSIEFESGLPSIDEDALYLNAHKFIFPSPYGGRWTFSVDGHVVDNNDVTGATDVFAVAPQLSYLNATSTFYADMGFAYSQYSDSLASNDDLHVWQWTPTLGFGTRALTDWVQLRGYLIGPSSSERAQGLSSTAALEARWTHWFVNRPLALSSLFVAGMLGERIYAVDLTVGAVYNLADMQRGAVSAGMDWSLGDRLTLSLVGAADRYRNRDINDDYTRGLLYVGVAGRW